MTRAEPNTHLHTGGSCLARAIPLPGPAEPLHRGDTFGVLGEGHSSVPPLQELPQPKHFLPTAPSPLG